MLKYVNTGVVFQEIPDEVTLSINISNCPCRCPGCHSKYLWGDIGTPLTSDEIDSFVHKCSNVITCICFMGGDAEPYDVANLAMHVKHKYKDIKTAWYSGKNELPDAFHAETFDYIKTGRYEAALGALDSRTTNQRMIKRLADGRVKDITSRFQKQVQEEKAATK